MPNLCNAKAGAVFQAPCPDTKHDQSRSLLQKEVFPGFSTIHDMMSVFVPVLFPQQKAREPLPNYGACPSPSGSSRPWRVEIRWETGQGNTCYWIPFTNRKCIQRGPLTSEGLWCTWSPNFLFMFLKHLVAWVSLVWDAIGRCRGGPACSSASLIVSDQVCAPALLVPVSGERTGQPPASWRLKALEAVLILSSPRWPWHSEMCTCLVRILSGWKGIMWISEG